jgi:hypothetical protein
MSDPLSHVASWFTPAADADLSRDSAATAEELAAVEFEAMGPEFDECFANSAFEEECRGHGITLRIASSLAQRTKSELIEGLRAMLNMEGGIDAFEDGIKMFKKAKERFEAMEARHSRSAR